MYGWESVSINWSRSSWYSFSLFLFLYGILILKYSLSEILFWLLALNSGSCLFYGVMDLLVLSWDYIEVFPIDRVESISCTCGTLTNYFLRSGDIFLLYFDLPVDF